MTVREQTNILESAPPMATQLRGESTLECVERTSSGRRRHHNKLNCLALSWNAPIVFLRGKYISPVVLAKANGTHLYLPIF